MHQDLDALISAAIRKAWPMYRQAVADKLAGNPVDWEPIRRELVKAVVLANLIGREDSAVSAMSAGADFDIEGEAIPLPSSDYAAPGRILSLPLVDAANEFRKTIPKLHAIFSDVLSFGESQAWLITGIEDETILASVGEKIATMLHDPETGQAAINMGQFFEETEEALQLARWRLENIFRTTVSSAAEAGKWIQDQDPIIRSITPFYRISTMDDSRVRPHHVVFQGFAALSSDPIWQQARPPYSFQCRCVLASVMTAEAEDRGWINLKGEITGKHRETWEPAIAAGLLTSNGTLTGKRVKLDGRWDTFPHEGFWQGSAVA